MVVAVGLAIAALATGGVFAGGGVVTMIVNVALVVALPSLTATSAV